MKYKNKQLNRTFLDTLYHYSALYSSHGQKNKVINSQKKLQQYYFLMKISYITPKTHCDCGSFCDSYYTALISLNVSDV